MTPVRRFNEEASWTPRGFAGDAGWAASRGKQMARNFGMSQQVRHEYRGSLWPILLIVFILVLSGAIDIAAHHW